MIEVPMIENPTFCEVDVVKLNPTSCTRLTHSVGAISIFVKSTFLVSGQFFNGNGTTLILVFQKVNRPTSPKGPSSCQD